MQLFSKILCSWNTEPEAVDLLIEIDRLELLIDMTDEKNYSRERCSTDARNDVVQRPQQNDDSTEEHNEREF